MAKAPNTTSPTSETPHESTGTSLWPWRLRSRRGNDQPIELADDDDGHKTAQDKLAAGPDRNMHPRRQGYESDMHLFSHDKQNRPDQASSIRKTIGAAQPTFEELDQMGTFDDQILVIGAAARLISAVEGNRLCCKQGTQGTRAEHAVDR
jgi:hypothetical protein